MTDIATFIRDRAAEGRDPFTVAIDGHSGSGKSTLAASLAADLGASVIQGDDFYAGGLDLVPGPPSHLADICINWRRQRSVLETLRLHRDATFAVFDWNAFTGAMAKQPVTISYQPIILLEGTYSARPELRDLVDLAIMMDTPLHLRRQRLIQREGQITDWERQWHLAEDWYFSQTLTAASFDLTVQPPDADLLARR